jgi:hypothetical protein
VHGNPIELLSRIGQQRLDELAADDAFVEPPRDASTNGSSSTCRARGGSASASRRPRPRASPTSRWSTGFTSPPHLLGGPRRPRGRSPEDRERSRPSARGRRPRLRRGLLPTGPQRRRLAGGALPDQRLAPPPRSARARAKRKAADHPRHVPARRRLRAALAVQVGRVPLFLARLEPRENAPADRSITGPLYGGDQEFRVRRRSCSASAASTRSRPSVSRRPSAT